MKNYEERLRELAEEEERFQFTTFSNDMALRIGLRLVEIAAAEGKAITVDLTRNGQQLFHYALPGTSRDNDEWIRRKNRVVERFGHSSFYMGTYYHSLGTTIDAKHLLDPRKYAPHGGAFPIILKDTGVIGTVTVSGLPQEEDHKLVVRVLGEFVTEG